MPRLCVAHLVDRAHFRPAGGSLPPRDGPPSCPSRSRKGVGMNPQRWVHRCAGSLFLLSIVCLAPAGAQINETARTTVELPPDPIARSPRLLGMGMLTLLQDRDNRIDLWNFAGNPVGLYDVDSTSVFNLRP